MPTLVLLCGIQGSGKSTFARRAAAEVPAVVVSTDAIRGELTGEYGRFDSAQSRRVFQIARQRLTEALASGAECVLFDATNATVKTRRTYVVLAADLGVTIGAIYFRVPIDVALARVAARRGQAPVPLHAIQELHAQFVPPSLEEGFAWVKEASTLDPGDLRDLLQGSGKGSQP